jgi:hypothetical protein
LTASAERATLAAMVGAADPKETVGETLGEPRGETLGETIDLLFEELIVHQRRRVLAHAQRLNPRITADDVLSPVDMPELAADPAWNYEDGVLAGYLSAQIAVRARLRRDDAG